MTLEVKEYEDNLKPILLLKSLGSTMSGFPKSTRLDLFNLLEVWSILIGFEQDANNLFKLIIGSDKNRILFSSSKKRVC